MLIHMKDRNDTNTAHAKQDCLYTLIFAVPKSNKLPRRPQTFLEFCSSEISFPSDRPVGPTTKQNIWPTDWGPDGLMDVFPICPNNFGHIGLCNVIDSLLKDVRELLVLYGGAVWKPFHPQNAMLRCCIWVIRPGTGLPFLIGLMNLVVRW